MLPMKTIEEILSCHNNDKAIKRIISKIYKQNNSNDARSNILLIAVELIKSRNFSQALIVIDQLELKEKSHEIDILKIDILEGLNRKKESLEILQHLFQMEEFPNEKISLGILRKLIKVSKFEHAWLYSKKYLMQHGDYAPAWPYLLRVALQVADWNMSSDVIGRLNKNYSKKNSPIYETPRTHLLWCDDQILNNRVMASFSKKNYPSKDIPRPIYENKKIRIGYISYDFRDHPTSLLVMGLLRHHNQDIFEIYGYCLSYDDGSALRRDIQSRFNHFKHVQNSSDEQIAEQIKKDQIDILIDLNGLTEGSRYGVFALRPAGVVISYLGFPGSVGNRFIDYVIGDEYTITENLKKHYPEKVIRLPWTYQINDYRARYLPPKAIKIPHAVIDNGPILGMFNNINKVRAECWDAWLEILTEVKGSQLWILDPGNVAQKNILKYCKNKNFNESRIIFVPKMKQEAHLKRLQWCDLMLDPWPYGGHTTTADAIFAGVPVVTLSGNNFASRVSAGLLKAAYLDGLVATTIDEYKKIAVKTLSNLPSLRKQKKQIIDQKMTIPIFDSVNRTVQIERSYLEIYRRYKADENFVNINIRQEKKESKNE